MFKIVGAMWLSLAWLSLAWLTLAIVAPVAAAPIPVTVLGEVEFNQITLPPLNSVQPSDAVEMTFVIDSEIFTDSASFPTRGYPIDPASFSLTFGSTGVLLEDPFPPGQTPYFVLRDNDPAVDGFFVSTDIDFPVGVPINVTGLIEQFLNVFSVTYEGDVLTSLDILDAVGAYDFTQLTVFGWTIDDGPFSPLVMIFSRLEIGQTSLFADGFESGDTSAW